MKGDIPGERVLLAALLVDPDSIMLVPRLRAEHFSRVSHQRIFTAILALNKRSVPIDIAMVSDELEVAGAEVPFTELMGITNDFVGGSSMVEHYATVIMRQAEIRSLVAVAQDIVIKAEAKIDPREIAADSIHKIEEVVTLEESKTLAIADVLNGTLDSIQRGDVGAIKTGYGMLDQLLSGGLRKSDLVIIAARPGIGKTALALNIMVRSAKKGWRSALFSLEMGSDQLSKRMISAESGVPHSLLRSGQISEDQWVLVMESCGALGSLKIHIDDMASSTVSEIRAKARQIQAREGLDVVIVDYIQLIGSESSRKYENRTLELGAITRALKIMAKDLGVCVIALSQLSRAVEIRQDKRPVLSDLRESGSIEQDADVVLMLYREDMVIQNSTKPGITEVILAKHRHGPTGSVLLFFDGEHAGFLDVETYTTTTVPSNVGKQVPQGADPETVSKYATMSFADTALQSSRDATEGE